MGGVSDLGGEARHGGGSAVLMSIRRTRKSTAGLVCVLLAGVMLASFTVGCSSRAAEKPVDPSEVVAALPAADPAQYDRVQDMKNWKNPYLILRVNGVDFYDAADNAEIHLKPEEVVPELAKLPASAWPYGRVVAVAETAPPSAEQDAIAMRRMKGIVGGILQGAKCDVKWVPTS